MAPAALFVTAEKERPYAVLDENHEATCPHCQAKRQPPVGKPRTKKVDLTLMVHPSWLKGAPGQDDSKGPSFGGSATDDAETTARWNARRARTLRLIEVRGPLPDEIECPDTKEMFRTDSQGGTVPKKSTFTCMEATCGNQWDVLEAIKQTKRSGPVAMYAIQGYCPTCDKTGKPYSGRFFDAPQPKGYDRACDEWERRREADLAGFWPRSEVPFGFMTSMNNGGIPNHGFSHWWMLFNIRQLLVHALLLRSIHLTDIVSSAVRDYALGAFQQYLRNQTMLAIWHISHDHFAPGLSNPNFHPKATMVELGVFTPVGYGPWPSTLGALTESASWSQSPWELVPAVEVEKIEGGLSDKINSKSVKVYPGDAIIGTQQLECVSSTNLSSLQNGSVDLVITDPPFGGLLHYSELSDFFYVWLRLVMKEKYPDKFTAEYTPKALEAVANRARQPSDSDGFYKKILTECWREASRILKPGGLLAFTFHHSEDEPWVAVLESLFQAGFYLEATYPIRSDETKGEGGKPGTYGSQLIEYDIIHVCRKRTEEPMLVSWARLRRQISQDVRQLQSLLTQHQAAGLQPGDVRVIRRGKALEYYSKHYGKVYVERDREFTVRDALLAINQLLDDQADATAEAPPVQAEPYTRQFLRLFADRTSIPKDQVQKHLRGTGVSPQEFIDRGWCAERAKVFYPVSPSDWIRTLRGIQRGHLSRDFDQVMFMAGACYEGSSIKLSDTLDHPDFKPHPATADTLDWLTRHGGSQTIRDAAGVALGIYRRWLLRQENRVKVRQMEIDFGEVSEAS